MKAFIVAIMLFSPNCFAITFKTSATKVKRATAAESVESEVALLTQISDCVKKIKTSENLNACGKAYISSVRTELEQKMLLAWFSLPLEVPVPSKCKPEDLEFIPEKISKGSKTALCTSYKLEGLEKKVIFLISEEKGQLKLFNLRD